MEQGMNVGKFNPRDEKYKTVEDLPPEAKEYFKADSSGGFVLKSVLQPDDFNFLEEFKDKAPLTEKENEERILQKINERVKTKGFAERFKVMFEEPMSEKSKFSPGKIRKEVQEEVLVEAMQEVALLAHEGLTKYPDMHFEKSGFTEFKFKAGEHELEVGSINPIILKGTITLDSQSHKVECVYANIKLGKGNYFGETYDIPRHETGRKLVQVYVDGEPVKDYYGKDLAEKIYKPVMMRDQYIPNEKSTRFPEEYLGELTSALSSIEHRMRINIESRVEEEEKRKQESKKEPSASEVAKELIEKM